MAKEFTVREVKNGYVVAYQDEVEGHEVECVFTKFFQVQRFIKDYLQSKDSD